MNRRSAIKVLGGGATAGVAGYAGVRIVAGPPTPNQVSEVEFTITDESASPRGRGGPTIGVSREDDRVEMTGTFLVGNTCAEARLDRVEYAGDSDEELVATVDGHVPLSAAFRGCGDALEANRYRLSFVVTPLPERITGIERDARGDTHSTTGTV